MCKEGKGGAEKESVRMSHEDANETLKKNEVFVEANPYLSSVGGTGASKLHSIWRKTVTK